MNFEGNVRQFARKIVDDFTYELGHSVSDPQFDFTKVPSKEIVALIDHIERVLRKALSAEQ